MSTVLSPDSAKVCGTTFSIPASRIEPDPAQPRKDFDADYIASLGESIKAEGLRQPITVRKNPEKSGHFLIVMGECRWRAHCHAGIQAVKCIVVTDCDDVADRFRRQVVENKGRKDMSLRDDAFAAKQMQDNGDADKTAAVAMCLSVSRLRNIRKMTVLSDDAWAHIKAGSINAGVAEYAAGAVPAEQLNALVLRCVGKNRKQAAAIVGNFVSEMNQASFELACESAGVKQKQADLAKLLAQQILQVAGTVAQLKGHHHRTFARTLSKEIAALVPNSKQTANGLLFIQRVMNDVGVNLADRKN